MGEIGYMIAEPFMKWREKVGQERANNAWESWIKSDDTLQDTIQEMIREGKIDPPPSQNDKHQE